MLQARPNFAWYSAESTRLGLKSPRCPFASVHACPRYYQSLSLLGGAGCTAIPKAEDDTLMAAWQKHPLWPTTMEQATSISGGDDEKNAYDKFCPEVAYDTFGLFATFLGRHVGEIDRGLAAKRLAKEGAAHDDPGWIWAFVTPQHYSECPLFSVLSHDWVKHVARPVPASAVTPATPAVRFDVFISHASEDKDAFVRALAAELTRLGLRVWYDESTLKLGDSLRTKIDEGLACSDYGVVVLSHAFFSKNWTQAELGGLFAREMQGRKVILPVRHGLAQADVVKYSPLLADKLAALTEKGVDAVAREIFTVVRPNAPSPSPTTHLSPEGGAEPKQALNAPGGPLAPLTALLDTVHSVSPLLYKLDDHLEGNHARVFLSALQSFFCGRNLLTEGADQDLLSAADDLLRVLPLVTAHPDYRLQKFNSALTELARFCKRTGIPVHIDTTDPSPIVRRARMVHANLLSAMENIAQPSTPPNTLLLKLFIALLEYAQLQTPKESCPSLGHSLHRTLRAFLSHALANNLNVAFPDELDTAELRDIKNYCAAAWKDRESNDHPNPE
jgi:hypothetical protein